MKFTITKSLLINVLNEVSHGLSSKTPMPVLTGIKIDAFQDSLIFTTTNREISVQVKVSKNKEFEIEEEGKCVVPGKYFVEIAKKIEENKINFVLFEESTIKITTDKTDFTMVALDKEAFPLINFETIGNPIRINCNNLKKAIKQTNFASGVSEARVILTGVCFEIKSNIMNVIATDSYRLAKKTIELDAEYPHVRINIPNKALDELEKILPDSNENAEVFLISNKALIKFGEISFITRLIEGAYPDTSALFPKDHLTSLTFKKNDLLSTVDRAALFTNMDSSNIIKVIIKSNKSIQIASNNNEIGRVIEEIIPLNVPEINNFQTAFSAKYFIEALKAFEENQVEIKFTGEIKPFVIYGKTDKSLVQLILPVRIF